MQTIIGQMLEQYRADSLGEERNALKEVVQEVRNGTSYLLWTRPLFRRSGLFSDRSRSVFRPESVFSDLGERDPRNGAEFHCGRESKVGGVKYSIGILKRQYKRTHPELFSGAGQFCFASRGNHPY